MVETSEQLLIRFRGICGHVDLPNGKNGSGKKKRTVLVRHRNGTGAIEHHIPYIEFFADDVESFTEGLKIVQYSRPGVDGRLARVDLDDATEIRLGHKLGAIDPGYVEEELSYRKDVPHMGEVVTASEAADSLQTPLAKDVDSGRAIAVFDMPKGRLVAGEPEPAITRFPKKITGFTPRRLARWSDLYTEYEPPLVVKLFPLGSDGPSRDIQFRDTLRMITIGNEPERLVLGIGRNAAQGNHAGHDQPQAPVQTTGHYILYYELLKNPPPEKERPVPIPTQFEGSGCPNNNYP